MRLLRACVMAALGASLVHAQPAQLPVRSAPADSLEPVLIELAIQSDGGATVRAFRGGDEAWLPVAQLLTLSDLAFERSASGEFTIKFPSGRRVTVDGAHAVVRVNGGAVALASGTFVVRDGELFAASHPLAAWLGIRFEISWKELRITAIGGKQLPAENRVNRAASRFVTPLVLTPPAPLGTRLAPIRPLLDGFVLDYDVNTPFNAPIGGASYTFGGGLTLMGGALDAQYSEGGGITSTQVSWTGVWRDQPWLTQLRLGDVPLTGTRFATVRGFAISNTPFLRPTYFGDATYSGKLAPDYEVESYVGGQLVAVDSTDRSGRFSRTLPVAYGSNLVDFVAYGPHDELSRFSQLFQILPQDFLPAGKFEYGLSGGQCEQFNSCQYTGNADFRYGVTSRASIEGGFEFLQSDSTGRVARPYFDFALNPINSIFIDAQQLALSSTTAQVQWQPSLDQSLSITGGRFTHDDLVAEIITGENVLDHYGLLYYLRPSIGRKTSYLTVDARRIDETDGAHDRARVSLGMQTPIGQIVPYVEADATHGVPGSSTSSALAGFNMFILPVRSLGPIVGQILAYGALERSTLGTGTTSLTLVRQFGNRFRVELGGNWPGGGVAGNYSLRVLSDLPQARVITTANFGPGGGVGSNFVSGSIIGNTHAGQVDFIPGPGLQRAGVTGRVYLDANVNGKFDAGDTPIAGALVRVGSVYALTDSSGRYRVWDLVPFEPVSLAIDISTLDSPLWAADAQHVVIEPWPNRFETFDVAIVPGGVVEGTVVDGRANKRGIGSVRVVLVESGTNRRMETTTFSDGGFSFLGVKPGRWSIAIDPRDAETLKGASAPKTVVVRAMENGDRVNGIELVLEPPESRP